MSTTWIFRIGRLALAKEAYLAIGGWQRLFWRLWWWEGERPPRRFLQLPSPLPPRPKPQGPMHWSPDAQALPFCGASSRNAQWTREFAAVGCAACREKGWPIVMHYDASTR
jgi:hypothetical protein